MKLREIKKLLNSLTEEELDNELFYNSEELCLSGVIEKITKAEDDMYISGDCDPDPIFTKEYLINETGEDEESIEENYILEIPKGSFYLAF